MADSGTERDLTQYDSRWRALEEVHFDWRCIVCPICGPVTWPFGIAVYLPHRECALWSWQHSLGQVWQMSHPIPHAMCNLGAWKCGQK